LENVFYNDVSLTEVFFIAEVSLLEAAREVSALAKLIDCVAIVGGLEIFNAGDNIGMFEPTNDVNLFPEKILNAHLLDLSQLDYLHRYCCLLLFIFRCVNFGESAFSQFG
jgi:hypothetical protein